MTRRKGMTHLADILQEELDARGWTLDDLALRMGGNYGIDRLALDMFFEVREKNVVLGDMANGLSKALGVSPVFFLTIHQQWRDSQPAKTDTTKLTRRRQA